MLTRPAIGCRTSPTTGRPPVRSACSANRSGDQSPSAINWSAISAGSGHRLRPAALRAAAHRRRPAGSPAGRLSAADGQAADRSGEGRHRQRVQRESSHRVCPAAGRARAGRWPTGPSRFPTASWEESRQVRQPRQQLRLAGGRLRGEIQRRQVTDGRAGLPGNVLRARHLIHGRGRVRASRAEQQGTCRRRRLCQPRGIATCSCSPHHSVVMSLVSNEEFRQSLWIPQTGHDRANCPR